MRSRRPCGVRAAYGASPSWIIRVRPERTASWTSVGWVTNWSVSDRPANAFTPTKLIVYCVPPAPVAISVTSTWISASARSRT
jgi:hypothetical protein